MKKVVHFEVHFVILYSKTELLKNKSESFVLSAFCFIRHSLALAGRFWMGGQYQQGVHRSHRNIEALLF